MKRAFTLVEMLVAIVLISLLIGVAVFSFRLQLMSVQKTKTEGLNAVLKYNQIKSAFESIKYYVVQEFDALGRPMRQFDDFFSGDEKHALFITNNPVYSDKVSLVELSCSEGELVYKEQPLYSKYMNYLRPSFTQDHFRTLKIYKDLSRCEFYYIDLHEVLMRNMTKKIPKEIYLRLEQKGKDISIYSKINEDDNLTAARIYDAVYGQE